MVQTPSEGTLLNEFAAEGDKLVHGTHTCFNESFNNLITRYAPKGIFYGKSYPLWVDLAVLHHNEGTSFRNSLFEELMLDIETAAPTFGKENQHGGPSRVQAKAVGEESCRSKSMKGHIGCPARKKKANPNPVPNQPTRQVVITGDNSYAVISK
eukprot:TRINITY_DN26436_c0_g1_i1.p1 TRINITY_DN26436_c0_g1~~TRINITY_DN26436_c0_g1_i1.p1  ORF type:complete len:154 (-),score=13.77 TRINITY_DN26436_c0_g1_i1:2-463(-)